MFLKFKIIKLKNSIDFLIVSPYNSIIELREQVKTNSIHVKVLKKWNSYLITKRIVAHLRLYKISIIKGIQLKTFKLKNN